MNRPTPVPAAVVKNDRKTIRSWAFFDWANSAYALVITVAIFPGYFLQITDDSISVLGRQVANSTLYAWCISLAYLLIALLSPLLSGIADYGGRKKAFLRFFTVMGALACIALFFFRGMSSLWLGMGGFVLATVGFAGGIVFYNAFLPIIATEDQYDRVSAKGFIYGYVGSVILLVTNLAIIMNYSVFGLSDGLQAARLAFVMVGLWWLGFAQIPFRRLPEGVVPGHQGNLLTKGYQELRKAWRVLRTHRSTLTFLAAFLCYNAGVNTVLFLAATFAEEELHFDATKLIILVLLLQLLAVAGAWLSTRLSERKGNKFSLMIQLIIWTGVCIWGYFVNSQMGFYSLAMVVGLVMGGIQALSRSTYAKFLPENTSDTASFYSFYDVMDKVSTVGGTFLFGFVRLLTGSMRDSVAATAVFFVISLAVLAAVRIQRMPAVNHS